MDGYTYDVFGALRSGSPGATDFLFTGEQLDADSDMYYLRARYYDPAIGRFLSHDQIPFVNRYAYVGNNPVNYVDPFALFRVGIPGTDIGVDVDPSEIINTGRCVLGPLGCAKSELDEVLVDPLLDSMPSGGAVKCVYHDGAVRCAADWAARQTARVLVGEKGYLDLNVTGGLYGVVGTGGLQMSYEAGLHPYAGGGVGSMGLAGSLTVGPAQSISEGWACSGQATYPLFGVAGVTGQAGLGGLGGSGPSPFLEGGAYAGTPGSGWAFTCYHVW